MCKYPGIMNALENLPKFYTKRSHFHIQIGESIKSTLVARYPTPHKAIEFTKSKNLSMSSL